MLIVFAYFFFWIVFFFVIAPLLLLNFSKTLKIEGVTFKKALTTYLITIAAWIPFLIISKILDKAFVPGKSSISFGVIEFFIGFAGVIVIIWIIKNIFETTIYRAIGVYLLHSICIVLISWSMRTYVFQVFKIPAGSMRPTLEIGDHFIANKLIYQFNKPEHGDIIIFPFPKKPQQLYIKRVVGISGDNVEMRTNKVYLNGKEIKEKFTTSSRANVGSSEHETFGPITVPENALFVLGDNRDHSYDSRFWGFVDVNTVIGKAQSIYWSYDRERRSVRWNRIGKTIE